VHSREFYAKTNRPATDTMPNATQKQKARLPKQTGLSILLRMRLTGVRHRRHRVHHHHHRHRRVRRRR
jgi:hypothetical protein